MKESDAEAFDPIQNNRLEEQMRFAALFTVSALSEKFTFLHMPVQDTTTILWNICTFNSKEFSDGINPEANFAKNHSYSKYRIEK